MGGEERREYEGGILLFLNPNSRIHAGSRSTHEHTHAHAFPLHPENTLKKSLHTKCSFINTVQLHADTHATMYNEKMHQKKRYAH